MPKPSSHRFCVAPMIDWTDRYCRFFHRQLSRRARLYTEMVVDRAVIHGDRDHLLGFATEEHPVALQLGGSDHALLAEAARIGEATGYDEINLNVGCPSDRVQSGAFGACLMRTPNVVADGVEAMAKAVSVPVTVKCRIGVDDQPPEKVLPDFVRRMTDAGVGTLIVHARKAWLEGLSPKENRTIPPLDYELVRRTAGDHSDCAFVLNGGISDLEQAIGHLDRFDGVMLGRAAYERPYLLAGVDGTLFGDENEPPSRLHVVARVAERAGRDGTPIWRYARHMMGLYHGLPGARAWRRHLTEEGRSAGAGPDWLLAAAEQMETSCRR